MVCLKQSERCLAKGMYTAFITWVYEDQAVSKYALLLIGGA